MTAFSAAWLKSAIGARARLLPAGGALLLAAGVLVAGTPQLKVYFAADFKDEAYQQKAYKKVAAAWKRPSGTPREGRKTVVIVSIRKDGTAPGARLHLTSGSDAWDEAALDAVTKAAPFDPLPAGYKRASVDVHFHFEYLK